MRRLLLPISVGAAVTASLLACVWSPAPRAEVAGESFASVLAPDADTFEIADDGAGDEARRPQRGQRDRDRPEDAWRDHGPRHRGLGPGHMGPPGGPDGHHHAMRAFREIIHRLGRIEEKLGIEAGPPSGREWDRLRRPRPEMDEPRAPRGDGDRLRERPELPEDVRRQMQERMEQGRRRMAEAKDRMEQARQRFQAMEERVKSLEAEIERLKGAK